jgi:sugar-specific transcriptional regulator TrmB
VGLLIQLGLTQCQANLYLTLLRMGETDAKTLARNSHAPRQAVYRTLQELLEMGFIEKEIGLPCGFRPIPIRQAMSILSVKKADEYKGFLEKIDALLQDFNNTRIETPHEKEHRFVIAQGRERLIQLVKMEMDLAQHSIHAITTLRRWLQILYYCFENHENALERGVRFRMLLEAPITQRELPENVLRLAEKPNFELRLTSHHTNTNSAIFDGKKVTLNFYPPKLLTESPLVWTNHPSFVEMCQSNFDKNWLVTPKLEFAAT